MAGGADAASRTGACAITSLALRSDARQQQTLSPRLQHAVRLLQLSSLDFAQEVRDALGRNPFLEAEDQAVDADAGDTGESGAAAATDTGPDGPQAASPADDGHAQDERDSWQADGLSSPRPSDDRDFAALDALPTEASLAGHLHAQLQQQAMTLRERLLAKAVIESLDDDGYLRLALDELLPARYLAPPASDAELQQALRCVQALEPAGVAARSVAECLMLQLPAIEGAAQRALAQRIVGEQLERLAAKDVAGLARTLDAAPADVDAACQRIRRLDPRPGWRFGALQVQYVTPDVVVRKRRGAWTVTLNPVIAPRVRLNRVYAEMFERHRASHGGAPNAELSAHLQEARWTVRNIEQRFATILGVAQEIVRCQTHFFDHGTLAMKPLGLRQVADEVGVHESTVSRVTNNKYMATPLGVFELKYFFSRALGTRSGGACSATAIRGLIGDMIAAERPALPLSDAEIARQLERQGLLVARRTVTKYRQMLRIDAVERRRRAA